MSAAARKRLTDLMAGRVPADRLLPSDADSLRAEARWVWFDGRNKRSADLTRCADRGLQGRRVG